MLNKLKVMINNLGIIQGRLSPPVNGKIQEFPKNWKREFKLMKQLNLNHIEWIVTDDSFNNNALFTEDLKGLPISSVCADNLINKDFYKKDFLKYNLTPICESAIKNNIEFITIPLLEDISIKYIDKRNLFLKNILPYTHDFPQLKFSLETDLTPEQLLKVLSYSNSFYITYDTGNIFSYGIDVKKYINLLKDKINNIHLKWKGTFDEGRYRLDSISFYDILILLSKHNYNNKFTLQMPRGIDGDEFNAIQHEINYFNDEWNNT